MFQKVSGVFQGVIRGFKDIEGISQRRFRVPQGTTEGSGAPHGSQERFRVFQGLSIRSHVASESQGSRCVLGSLISILRGLIGFQGGSWRS